jgi:protein gp37/ParB-like chromosome segregation protein Spo0J
MSNLIGLDALAMDARLQPRANMDTALIQEYADAMGRGDVFPPVHVVTDGTSSWLVDGWHRVLAAKSLGLAELPATVQPGAFEDAEDYTLTVNRSHGLRRTHADVQAAIRRALLMPRWVERSDAWIGRHIGCNDKTVSGSRERMEATSEIPKLDELLGEDGKRRPRTRAATSAAQIVIADTYTIDQWKALDAKDHARVWKAARAIEGRAGFNSQEDNDNIEWARWSWNPVTGCKHNCPYCYARDIAERFKGEPSFPHGFEPVLHPKRLFTPSRVPVPGRAEHDIAYRNVFVCSMADLFGRWVPEAWIEAVLSSIAETPQWNFLFLTKFPVRLSSFSFPDNAWVGTSVDCQARVANAETAMARVDAKVKWLSCEPLIEPLTFTDLSAFQWVVIGGASPSRETPEWKPPRAWVDQLSAQAWAAGCKIYEKDNLLRRWRQYPGHDDQPADAAPTPFHYLRVTRSSDEQVEVA